MRPFEHNTNIVVFFRFWQYLVHAVQKRFIKVRRPVGGQHQHELRALRASVVQESVEHVLRHFAHPRCCSTVGQGSFGFVDKEEQASWGRVGPREQSVHLEGGEGGRVRKRCGGDAEKRQHDNRVSEGMPSITASCRSEGKGMEVNGTSGTCK